MKFLKSFSTQTRESIVQHVNPQTAAIIMSYGFTGTINSSENTKLKR